MWKRIINKAFSILGTLRNDVVYAAKEIYYVMKYKLSHP